MSLTTGEAITLWRVNCGPTGYEMVWSKDAPTTCTDPGGLFVNAKARQTIAEQSLVLKQEAVPEGKTPTGGRSTVESKSFTCPMGVSTHDFSWPYPVTITKIHGLVDASFAGDSFSVELAPNTAVANLSADVSAAETVLTLDTLDHVFPGLKLGLDDTTKSDDLGLIASVDEANVQVTVSTATTQAFLSATPTQVLASEQFVRNYIFGAAGTFAVGDSKSLGTYVDGGTTVRVRYTNTGATPKTFHPAFEFLY